MGDVLTPFLIPQNMACALTTGRTEPCKEAVGGIKSLIFLDYAATNFTVSGGQVTGIAVGITEVFEWSTVAPNTTLVQTPNTNGRSNGTTVITQRINARFIKQDYQTSNELILLQKARPIIVAKYNDGTYKLVGHTEGCYVVGGEATSGADWEDFNGYEIQFEAKELQYAPTLDASTVTALEALVSATEITP